MLVLHSLQPVGVRARNERLARVSWAGDEEHMGGGGVGGGVGENVRQARRRCSA